MLDVDLLEWTFAPSDYFEQVIKVIRDDYKLVVGSGVAEARVPSEVYDANPDIVAEIHASLKARLLGVQLVSFRPFDLSDARRTRLHADGRKDIFITLKGASMTITGGTVDVEVKTSSGDIVYSSKQQRTQQKRSIAELVAKYKSTDPTLALLLDSHNHAVLEPQNELVSLYEIRDGIATRFSGKWPALQQLEVDAAIWKRLGQLCNDEPLRQGRHRSKSGTNTRDATERELQEARDIARTLLESYLRYLERNAT